MPGLALLELLLIGGPDSALYAGNEPHCAISLVESGSFWSRSPRTRHACCAIDLVRLKPQVADRRAESCKTDSAASARGAPADSPADLSAKRASSQDLSGAAGFLYADAALRRRRFCDGCTRDGLVAPGVRAWPTAGVLRRLRARLAALQLDHRLVAGEDPVSDPALACRAAQLTRRRCRDQLACGLERLLSRTRRRAAFSAAIPFDRRAVEIARPALEQLAIALRSPELIQPRGVALTRLLLTDPSSAVYAPAYSDQLYDIAREALLAVDPGQTVPQRYLSLRRAAGFDVARGSSSPW